ncbi:MAG TPA: glycoside hydrolase family 31 protein [Lysobacter sp.]|nr:glycoside hydrolase family 31 protein [Lysobacter sp.]
MGGGIGKWGLGLVLLLVAHAATAQGWRHLGAVEGIERRADGVELAAGVARVRVSAHADGVLRVRMAPRGRFAPDRSWAVVQRGGEMRVAVSESAEAVELRAGALIARIGREPLSVVVHDADGRVLLAGDPDLPMAVHGERVRAWARMPAEERYYGLGDKPGPIDRRGRAFVNWNTDAYAWQGHSDPLYKSIPFVLALRKDGFAWGLFLDSPYRSHFDFGKESEAHFSFGADGGELDYYVIAGPTPAQVIERYTALTGRTPLPPKWALGFQQSRYSYSSEAKVREVARTLRERRIPADAIYLDIDYQQGHAPFTVDRAKFPNFERMIADLRGDGLRTVLITDLHIKRDPDRGYAPYDSGMAQDAFVRNADGSVYVGPVWPGDSVFPDFTLGRVRRWWGGLYRDFVRAGVAGFWNDMNEPSVFNVPGNTMPPNVQHRLDDGPTLDHRAVHNVYGMQNARATYEGLLALKPDTRPFVLTRAAYAGTQRYAATWTGDNTASWHHLSMSTATLLSLGLSGYAMAGDDVGGFIGSPDPELLTRWYQLGAFNPVFRSHAATDTRPHEAWVDGPEHEARRREAIELRYRLMPYLYTLAEENARTGLPILRPVFLHYPHANTFHAEGRSFLFGRDLFVAPAVTETVDPHRVTLPPGAWYDLRDGRRYTAQDKLVFEPKPRDVPVYARAGAIIPMQPLVQHTGETPRGALELHVFLPEPGQPCEGALYDDDGETFAYRRGGFLRVRYECAVDAAGVRIFADVEHARFAPWWRQAKIVVHGVGKAPVALRIDGRAVRDWVHDEDSDVLRVPVTDARRDWVLDVRL